MQVLGNRDPRTGALRKSAIYPGWGVIAGAFLGNGVFGAVGLVAIGFFFKPMSESLGWSRGATSLALSLRTVFTMLPAPLFGSRVDAWGARPFVFWGAVTAGLSTAGLALVTELWQFYLLYGLIGSVCFIGIGNLVTGTAVSKWFVRKRGRALGIADSGVAVSVASLAPLAELMIGSIGWRAAWMVLGIVTTAVVAPASLLMRRQPEDYGLKPDGFSKDDDQLPDRVAAQEPMSSEPEWTRSQVVRTPTFWLLVLMFNAGGVAISGVLAHQIPHITDMGFTAAQAATALSIWAVFSAISRIGFGILSDLVPIRYVVTAVMFGSATGVLLLLWVANAALLYAFAVVYGLFRGAYVMMTTLVWANYYGRKSLGSINGIVLPFNVVSHAGGPLLAGFLFDLKGDYSLALQVFAACYILACVLALLAKQPMPQKGSDSRKQSY